MNDLAMHILDIVQNSISAGAKNIWIEVLVSIARDLLSISVRDDGKGMTPEMVAKVTDPYCTTRTTRKVGLGLPLLRQGAEQAGGSLSIDSTVGVGTTVKAEYGLSHIDRPPMGDLANAYVLLLGANPNINITLHYITDENDFSISTRELDEALDGLPLNDPQVMNLIYEMVSSNI
ncbi:MAG TPA: ATP-binding protein [Bacteroidales bacterium]|nr:ATP-binding protein [Bacteroidales bacterium]